MLVLSEILRLFVHTLSYDDKCSLLYTDNLTQPIQILLFREKKTFSKLFSAFLKSKLNFEYSRKKDDPHSPCICQITISEKGDQINVCKIPFKSSLPRKTWQKGPKTVEICTTLPLPYLFIPLDIILLEKIYLSSLKTLNTVS